MARSISTDKPIYRAVVTKRKHVPNPDFRIVYDANGSHAEGDRYIWSDETYVVMFGPYENIGTARSMVTREAKDWRGNPNPAFVAGGVQEGTVHWEDHHDA